MTPRQPLPLAGLLIIAILLAACNLPTSATQDAGPTQPEAVYTSAARTIAAQLTQISNPSTATPPLAASPVPPQENPENGSLPPDNTQTAESPATQLVTATTAASETPAAEGTGTPAVTPASTDPKASLGDPTWLDSFLNNANWPIFDDEHVEMRLEDGQLEMTALNPDKWDSWMISTPVIQDFYLEVTARPETCSGLDRYGMLARAPEANEGYLFGFSCDGQYSLRKWDGENFTPLVDWTASPHILDGADQTNRLGLMADGDRLSLYANGNLLSEVTDGSYESGGFGLFVGSVNTEDFTVQFLEVAYWDLP